MALVKIGIIVVVKRFFIHNWSKLILGAVLLWVVLVNFRPGYFILGNDNYSPEVNPTLSLKRYIESPGWRSYRVVGVASDADQADLPRALTFSLLGLVVPWWLLSQGFVFLNLFLGVWSIANLGEYVCKKSKLAIDANICFLVAGVAYLGNY